LVVCLLGLGGASKRWWRWIGVACAAVALVLWLGDIWIGGGSTIGFVTFVGSICTSAAIAYAVACQLVPLKLEQQWFRGATIGSVVLTAGLVWLWMVVEEDVITGLDESLIARCAAAAGIASGCGILALAVLARLGRHVDLELDGGELTQITVVCPRCHKKQSLPIGDATCSACKLRISIRVEEPRCPNCEYLLIGLTSNRCPECGTELAALST